MDVFSIALGKFVFKDKWLACALVGLMCLVLSASIFIPIAYTSGLWEMLYIIPISCLMGMVSVLMIKTVSRE